MNVTIGVEQYVVRFDIAVDDVLAVYISQSASKLGNPKPNSLFGESLSRDVEPQISTSHQIDHKVHVFDVLETVSQVTDERMIDIFQHSPFSNNVTHAFRSHNFIFSDIFKSKGKIRVLSLDNSYLSKGTSADDSQEAEMIEVHFAVEVDGFSLAVAHREEVDMVDDVELS
jgi:hypothetical protein